MVWLARAPWDAEDEEKHTFSATAAHKKEAAVKPKRQSANDDLVAAREKGPRGWEHEFQGVPEESKRELEEEKGGTQKHASPQKEKEKVHRLRRAGKKHRDAGSCSSRGCTSSS